ncbi:MAG: hypothetical protein PVH19_01380 [Planctomycetia bacterium]|jgi:hypothetical protein
MIRHLVIILAAGCAVAFFCTAADASNWVFRQAQYTHSPTTGERVTQYAPEAPVYAPTDPTYRQSGLILQNIRLRNARGGIDQILLRERWGDPWFWGYGWY